MNSQRIYERKVNGLDNSVWLFMFIIMLLSVTLLTSFLIDRKKCIPFSFKITPKADSGYYTEKNLSFTLSTSAKTVTWDFGDGTPEKTGVFVSHEYHKAGKFYVTASIKDGCDTTQEITVNKSPLDHSIGNEIEGPESIGVEKEAEFSCTVYGTSWKWEVMDHPEIKAKTEKLGTAKFRFASGGTYYVQVTLDDDRTKSYRKEIVISDDRVKRKTTDIDDIKRIPGMPERPKPEQPQPQVEATSITFISNSSFKSKLNDVIADDASSPSLEYFNQFLDNGAATTVKIEGTTTTMNFSKFYANLRKNGSLKIADVKIDRSPDKKVMFIRVTFSN